MPSCAGPTMPSCSQPARYTRKSHSQITTSGASACSAPLRQCSIVPSFVAHTAGIAFAISGRLLGREHVARRRRVEHPECDVGAVGDVLEEAQHAFAAVHLHRRRLQVADVGARGLRVLRELDAVLRRRCARARLDHDVGLDRTRFVDRDLHQLLALVHGERPPLGDAARQPQHRVVEVADAVAHERAVRVEVDVVAVGAAERRVQRVTDPVQAAFGGPVLGVPC